MSLNNLLTNTLDIYRTQQGPGVQTKYGILTEGVPCLIQPQVGEFYAKTGMNYGRTYNCLMPLNTDILISDKVIDQDGIKYQVTGFFRRNYGSGAVQHMTVILTEETTAGVPAQ